ncbi:MAG TPA: hypothetical protein VF209_04895, partial [Patescibacteria group bacterium]
MCGIYGVSLSPSSQKNATELVFQGIKRIEYRGYDSWGVAALKQKKTSSSEIKVYKKIGKISEVKSVAELKLPAARTALGHTRWATHGGVTEVNAHPHLASDGSFVLVQNGVVENYQALKNKLQQQGYTFKTQTDTEVIVRLLERSVQKAKGGKLTAKLVSQAVKQLDGRSTVLIMTVEGDMYAFRYGSPLVVGRGGAGSIYFSSDVLSMSQDAIEYIAIDHGQLVSYVDGQLHIHHLTRGTEITPV